MTNTPTFTPAEELQRQTRTRQLVTWLIVFAIVMFFAGLTSAYVVSKSGGYWVHVSMPTAFQLSTVAILVSSVFAQLALSFTAKGRTAKVPMLLGITLVLGLVFTWSQFQGWSSLVALGNYTTGKVLENTGEYGVDWTISRNGSTLVLEDGKFYDPADGPSARPRNAELEEQKNTSSSYFYVLTAAHLAHLAFGLVSLLVMIVMAAKGRYTQLDHAGLWSGVVYWHFLGALWVYLLLFLSIVH
jgi:cytochrome c oxidase subunit III